MMLLDLASLALGAVTLARTALGSPVLPRSTYAVKSFHPVPRGWNSIGRAPTDHKLEMRFGLKQNNFAGLEERLYQVSDPEHAHYGQHLTANEVHNFVRPSRAASDAVHDWLYNHGLSAGNLTYSASRDWIKVTMTVADVEVLLDTVYHTYVSDDGHSVIRTSEWSLPQYLHEHVSTIQPTNSFFVPRTQGKLARGAMRAFHGPTTAGDLPPPTNPTAVAAVCDSAGITPLCLRTLYGTVNYTVQSANQNEMACNNFLGDVTPPSDIQLQLQTYRPEAVAAAQQYVQISINNGPVQQTPLTPEQANASIGVEADLDAETLLGIAWPTPLKVYSTGGAPPFDPDFFTTENTNEPYLDWLNYILAQPDPLPPVISTSYGDDEQTVPKDYAVQVCNGLAQLGARGVSLLFSSGDYGVGPSGYCISNDGKNTSMFVPLFPASCPYVTTVGGTYKFNPEVPVFDNTSFSSLFTAGGGFSNYFSTPSYQKRAVSNYISESLVGDFSYPGLYNPNGRAYPDLSAQASNYSSVWNGSDGLTSGTSAAAPAVAAILALVNDALIAANKSTLGFLNPFLYKYGYKAFNDVNQGSNYGCDTLGFPAVDGWDAATGWGTPKFQDILALRGVGKCEHGQWCNW